MASKSGAAEVVLRFSLPPAGLRRNHEANRWAMTVLKDQYSERMYLDRCDNKLWPPPIRGDIEAEVVWKQCGEGDVDNTLAALKPCFDNMGMAPPTKAGANRYYLGVYESDSQIKRICVERERVSKRADECVVIKLRPR